VGDADGPAVTVILPSYLRPQRTRRAIASVTAQTWPDWELWIVGDGCPVIEEAVAPFRGDGRIQFANLFPHEGQWGTQCLNYGLQHATGRYVCFLGNDDYLEPEHLATRLTSIAGTSYDFVYHDARIHLADRDFLRGDGSLAFGQVGGSELICRRLFLVEHGLTFRDTAYGHDHTWIEDLCAAGATYAHYPSATYVVCHLPGHDAPDDLD
jgi:glycosyltransferase involved in cell wall biosynthesis